MSALKKQNLFGFLIIVLLLCNSALAADNDPSSLASYDQPESDAAASQPQAGSSASARADSGLSPSHSETLSLTPSTRQNNDLLLKIEMIMGVALDQTDYNLLLNVLQKMNQKMYELDGIDKTDFISRRKQMIDEMHISVQI